MEKLGQKWGRMKKKPKRGFICNPAINYPGTNRIKKLKLHFTLSIYNKLTGVKLQQKNLKSIPNTFCHIGSFLSMIMQNISSPPLPSYSTGINLQLLFQIFASNYPAEVVWRFPKEITSRTIPHGISSISLRLLGYSYPRTCEANVVGFE